MKKLTHFDKNGAARMVDVGEKTPTLREATACGRIKLSKAAFNIMTLKKSDKGDVLGIARIAGILAAKRTSELIPLCHSIPISQISIDFLPQEEPPGVGITAEVKTNAQTGVEMEALTAVSIASLTIYDMLKSIDKGIEISDIHLTLKRGGKSGDYKKK